MRLLTLAAALVVPGLAFAQTSVKFHSEDKWAPFPAATISATVHKPDGLGPFPAMIVVHDCSGIGDHTAAWARRVVRWGYAAIVPDSFGSRGQGNVCQNTVAITERQRVPDVIGAAQFLATLPHVRKDSIGVVGFSHGGGAIMKGVQRSMEWPKFGIKAAVAYYPFCNPGSEENVAVPLLILIGESDDWTPAARCQTVARETVSPSLVTLKVYPSAYHAFDRDLPTRWVQGMGEGGQVKTRKLEYNSAATRDAEAQTKAFLERQLN